MPRQIYSPQPGRRSKLQLSWNPLSAGTLPQLCGLAFMFASLAVPVTAAGSTTIFYTLTGLDKITFSLPQMPTAQACAFGNTYG
jgi:hypothetical protein